MAAWMAIDQWGNTFHGLERPRRDLLRKLGRKRAQRMYRDDAAGHTYHCGWIIAGHWCEVFRVEPMHARVLPSACDTPQQGQQG